MWRHLIKIKPTLYSPLWRAKSPHRIGAYTVQGTLPDTNTRASDKSATRFDEGKTTITVHGEQGMLACSGS